MNAPKTATRFRIALLLIPIFLLIGLYFLTKKERSASSEILPVPPVKAEKSLAPLGTEPNWNELDIFQKMITREEFAYLLESVYTKNQAWKPWIRIANNHAEIRTHALEPEKKYRLDFAELTPTEPPRYGWNWQRSETLPPAPADTPLSGIHIALDPGHIGGDFAKMEARDLSYGGHSPIREGEMTLLTCQKLKPMLENLGAKVSLVRTKNEPVTNQRPKDFHTITTPQKVAEQIFYRTAEIRARADLVNEKIQPDLVLCFHFNATGSPVPLPGQHFHLLINGAYHPSELIHDDERFQMLTRLLSRTYADEIPLARSFAAAFASETGLPPYQYSPTNPYALNLDNDPAIWARNLLANRSYHCPVIFFEPYIMNSPEFITRHEMGDYDGLKEVDGVPRVSLYQEYADTVTLGLREYFSSIR